jgi:hypothetical protein
MDAHEHEWGSAPGKVGQGWLSPPLVLSWSRRWKTAHFSFHALLESADRFRKRRGAALPAVLQDTFSRSDEVLDPVWDNVDPQRLADCRR